MFTNRLCGRRWAALAILGLGPVLLLGVFSLPVAAAPQVKMSTSMGVIVLELDPDQAPFSVENFLTYVRDGHYDSTLFHRVIETFMIQGGGFTAECKKKATRAPIQNEAANGLRNDRGTIAMARTGDPHSATSQFFINVVDNDFLNYTEPNERGWGYAVFGKVIEGMDVVDSIRSVKTGPGGPFPQDAPLQPVVIDAAVISERGIVNDSFEDPVQTENPVSVSRGTL